MRDVHATARTWRSFRGTPPGTLAFLAARLAILPLGGLDRELRALRGRVLSLGCGFGVAERYLAEINPQVQVDGIELDRHRVEVAQATEGAAPRVSVREQDLRTIDAEHAYDAALAVDVLHHIPRAEHADVAASLHTALRPGGVLLIKDIATRPRWRHKFNQYHDYLVTGELTWDARSPGEMADVFTGAGFVAEGSRVVGRVSPYPHYLLTLRRPVTNAAAPPPASSSRKGSTGTR